MEALIDYLEKLGIAMTDADFSMAWIVDGTEVTVTSSLSSDYRYWWNKWYGHKELLVDDRGIYWDMHNCQKLQDGINIVLFDKYSQTIADSIGIKDNTITR